MKRIEKLRLTGERALFFERGSHIIGCTFEDGESPLKHSRDILVERSSFGWKYPMWYSESVEVKDSHLKETARSGIWYTENIGMTDCVIDAPKTFRRAKGVRLTRVKLNNAEETMWSCRDVYLKDAFVRGDYFCMNCENVYAEGLTLDGNYGFDGCKGVTVKDSVLNSKDAFWNCEDVRVEHSRIIGEYLAWNSRRVTLVDCHIESNQGLCYVSELVLDGCTTAMTDLCFEYSTVDARVNSDILSVKNPISGVIRAESIGEVILEDGRVDTSMTEIIISPKGDA